MKNWMAPSQLPLSTMTVENTKRVFIDTLEYIRQLVEIRKQPVARLSEYGNVSVTEAETTGLPGIQFCPDAENEFPAWLSLERLHPSAPPEPQKTLVDWVVLTKVVDTEPKLREWIMRTVSNMEAQSLIGQGIAQEEHVEQSPRDPSLYDVRLFSADNTKTNLEGAAIAGDALKGKPASREIPEVFGNRRQKEN
ncbi:MAG: hypothetical protein ACLFS4_03130 [Opitutales bacterium]